MAELEVVKHTKKVYHIFGNDSPVFEKVKEFVIEILIIVFAVSITIWFHDLAEHRHQQKEVKGFLVGLKNDLANDLKEIRSDRQGYQYQQAAFKFFREMNPDAPGTVDSLEKYTNAIFNKVELVQNNGRFEGFKSSGKIGNIEDKKLQNDILDLYQELIPSLLSTTQLYNNQKDRLIILIEEKARFDQALKRMDITEVMELDQAKIISSSLMFFPAEIVNRYDLCIARMNEIVKTIDETYGE
ncbi:DUF6090 family protein [Chryseosolibacter indicus]|uniref:Uncharacterized protein n=1 Tax=Chryseosolibacter indicus TaxID=2782351 RepID=A0ABS5VXH9_9BACT|nr:DUF6090 family protein [Chryseosolibacter indicus]MBT1706110.1 hypothetical protein [Chryseosolibacter indicus]